MIQEIQAEDYSVQYDEATGTLTWKGSLRLSGMEEYAPILELLNQAIAYEPPLLTLDLRHLEFLNSSGINMLSKFVIKIRQDGKMKMRVLGSKTIPWQSKSLRNLPRLMSDLQLEFE